MWKGLPLGDSGFVTLAAEYKDQEHTERGGWDARRQYPLLPGNALDPREATFNRFNSWYGEPEVEQKTLFVNAGSVGKPKDGDPRAGYVLARFGASVEVEFRRVAYDAAAAARAVRVSGLPAHFADLLETGARRRPA